MRMREVAEQVGITERAVWRIIRELEEAQVLSHHRDGRRNFYQINEALPLRHPLESQQSIGELLRCLVSTKTSSGD